MLTNLDRILRSRDITLLRKLSGEGDGTPLQYSCMEKSHGQRSLVGCSPWGRQESYMTERLHLHFSLSWIGAGTGNPLQCSGLESPRDEGAWWAAVSGVTQSLTRLKWLSSSSSQSYVFPLVMFGCESWTVKKAGNQRIDAFVLCDVREDSLESLGLQGDTTSPS